MDWNNGLNNLLPFPTVCIQSLKTLVSYRPHIARIEFRDCV
jgi:hypothetical protein